MKQGQKVVFRTFKGLKRDSNTILPKDNTIVTLMKRAAIPGFWRLVEYPLTVDGHRQAFHKKCLHPLVDDEALEKELASIPETKKV